MIEDQIVQKLIEIMQRMLPKEKLLAAGPQVFSIVSFQFGEGAGLNEKNEKCKLLSHPGSSYGIGDTVVGIPIRPGEFYIVGKR